MRCAGRSSRGATRPSCPRRTRRRARSRRRRRRRRATDGRLARREHPAARRADRGRRSSPACTETEDGTRRSLSHRRHRAADRRQGRSIPEKLTHELYRAVRRRRRRQEGAQGSRRGRRKGWPQTAAASLIQQRERVLDLAEEMISQPGRGRTAPRRRTPRSGTSRRSARRSRSVQLAGQARRPRSSSARRWPRSCGPQVETFIKARETELGPLAFFFFARHFYLEEIDAQWIDHLKSMEPLREGIGLRGYGQKDPEERVQEGRLRHVRRDDGPHRGNVATSSSACGSSGSSSRRRARRSSSRRSAKRSCPSSSTRSAAWSRSTRRRAAVPLAATGRRRPSRRSRRRSGARQPKVGPQRALSLRLRQEVQEVPRRHRRRLSVGAPPSYHSAILWSQKTCAQLPRSGRI